MAQPHVGKGSIPTSVVALACLAQSVSPAREIGAWGVGTRLESLKAWTTRLNRTAAVYLAGERSE